MITCLSILSVTEFIFLKSTKNEICGNYVTTSFCNFFFFFLKRARIVLDKMKKKNVFPSVFIRNQQKSCVNTLQVSICNMLLYSDGTSCKIDMYMCFQAFSRQNRPTFPIFWFLWVLHSLMQFSGSIIATDSRWLIKHNLSSGDRNWNDTMDLSRIFCQL